MRGVWMQTALRAILILLVGGLALALSTTISNRCHEMARFKMFVVKGGWLS